MTKFWQSIHTFNHANKKPLLIHVVSHQRVKALTCLLNSLALQTEHNFDVCITHDHAHDATHDAVAAWAQTTQINTTLKFTSERMHMWGHPMRARMITECDHDYVLLTNDDNYYVPPFTHIMMHTIWESNADMVMCDMIHSHDNPGITKQPPYNLFVTQPKLMHCDVGCLITKTKVAQTAGFTHCDHSHADGLFVERIMQMPNITWRKVPQVLFVHN